MNPNFRNLKVGSYTGIDMACIDLTHKVTIGYNVSVSNNACILTHSSTEFHNKKIRNKDSNIVIKDNVFIGAKAIILTVRGKCLTIGENSIIGAGAIVTKDVPSNSLAIGVPAKIKPLKEIKKKNGERSKKKK